LWRYAVVLVSARVDLLVEASVLPEALASSRGVSYIKRRAEASVAEDVVIEASAVACRRLRRFRRLAVAVGMRASGAGQSATIRAEALTDCLRSAARSPGGQNGRADPLSAALEQLDGPVWEPILVSS
jgi:hypothetical protein